MKTVLDIADPLFTRAKRVAAGDGQTLRAPVQVAQSRLRERRVASRRRASVDWRAHPPLLRAGWQLKAVDEWLKSPTLHMLGETGEHWAVLLRVVDESAITGPAVHDARVAAICLEHGVSELWTADRDFGRFPSLRTRNPLIG